MRKTKRIGDTRYVFSSEGDLKVGDEVFPIYYNGEWDWVNITGFPDKPHIVLDEEVFFKNNPSCKRPVSWLRKETQTYTTYGYGDRNRYFKIIESRKIEDINKQKVRNAKLKLLLQK